jgi:division/cell wall cluster transcriptional repressor MraZ
MGDQPARVLLPLINKDEATLDDKGRLLFSKQKRDRLGDVFAIGLCDNGCLAAYPLEVWAEMWAKIRSYSPLDLTFRRYSELLYNYADDEVKFDPQNRAVINKTLRTEGKLTSKVHIYGCGDRAELWDPVEREIYEKNKTAYAQQRREEYERAWMQLSETLPRR